MPDVMSVSADVAVTNGPHLSFSSSFVLAGYDVTSITVDGGEDATVAVQPAAADEVRVLAVTASRYEPADLTYDLGGVSGLVLDGPQLFTGVGMLSRFTSKPDSITVHNGAAVAVTVSVLVGRVASP